MGIFRFILILPVSALTIETAVYRTVRTLRCERTGVNLPLLLDTGHVQRLYSRVFRTPARGVITIMTREKTMELRNCA